MPIIVATVISRTSHPPCYVGHPITQSQWKTVHLITMVTVGGRTYRHSCYIHLFGYSGRYGTPSPWLQWDIGHPINTLVTVGDGATHRPGYSERPSR